MSVASAKKIEFLAQADDPRMGILEAIGDVEGVEILKDLVLVATYIRHEKTAGGVIRPLENVGEDEFQGKVGLVLKVGPDAWGGWEPENERGRDARIGTWIVAPIKDSWPLQINDVPCRVVPYERIRMRVKDPSIIF